MFKPYTITVDTMKKVQNNMFTINTNDLNTPKIIINIKQNGVPVILADGVKVRLEVKKPDNKLVFQDCTIIDPEEGLCTVVLNSEAFEVQGKHEAELMVYYSLDRIAVTSKFAYTAIKGLFNPETIESSNSFSAFNQIVFDAQTAEQNASEHEQNALLSAQQAKLSEDKTNQTVVETIEARTNGQGKTFASLKERMNDFDFKVSGAGDVYFPMYTPQQKGAKGDGIQDDTPYIQGILYIAISKGAVYCHIPKGVYRITSKLIVSKNTKIIMDKQARLLRDHSSGWFINGRTGDSFTGYNGNGNITIEGGILDGNLTKHYKHYNAIGLARGQNIVLRDIEIIDVRGAHAVDMNACKDVLIEGCKFKGYDINYTVDGDGVSYYREAIQIANHTDAGFNNFGAFDAQPCENVTVRDCYFGKSDNFPAYPTAVGNHSAVVDLYMKNIRIYKNTFDGMTYAGLRPYKFENTMIRNNTFINCETGIRYSNPSGNGTYDGGKAQSGKNTVIQGNHFIRSKSRDIYIVGWVKDGITARVKNIQILDNIFEGVSNAETMYLSFCEDVLIRGNISNITSRFVMGYYSINVSIKDNLVSGITNEVVYVSDATADGSTSYVGLGYTKDYYISGNRVENCGRSAFNLSGLDGLEVHSNIVINATTETVGTRSVIVATASTRNGRIYNNKVRGANQKYGVDISAGCQNIQTFNNDLVGSIKPMQNNSVGGFEGTYMHSANGTRYKMTVSDAGAPVFIVG
ncbi:BppU family phage baseplate upper protein [Peribacillus frigoritolerans]|uniref:BppU family phage baseplate upper protein n=1 Tax=Peribacillus frigoritolerans TaxID=450367 RepID=UPI003CFEDB4B